MTRTTTFLFLASVSIAAVGSISFDYLNYCEDDSACPGNTTCINLVDGVRCPCRDGFVDIRRAVNRAQLDLGRVACLDPRDVDRCALGLETCKPNNIPTGPFPAGGSIPKGFGAFPSAGFGVAGYGSGPSFPPIGREALTMAPNTRQPPVPQSTQPVTVAPPRQRSTPTPQRSIQTRVPVTPRTLRPRVTRPPIVRLTPRPRMTTRATPWMTPRNRVTPRSTRARATPRPRITRIPTRRTPQPRTNRRTNPVPRRTLRPFPRSRRTPSPRRTVPSTIRPTLTTRRYTPRSRVTQRRTPRPTARPRYTQRPRITRRMSARPTPPPTTRQRPTTRINRTPRPSLPRYTPRPRISSRMTERMVSTTPRPRLTYGVRTTRRPYTRRTQKTTTRRRWTPRPRQTPRVTTRRSPSPTQGPRGTPRPVPVTSRTRPIPIRTPWSRATPRPIRTTRETPSPTRRPLTRRTQRLTQGPRITPKPEILTTTETSPSSTQGIYLPLTYPIRASPSPPIVTSIPLPTHGERCEDSDKEWMSCGPSCPEGCGFDTELPCTSQCVSGCFCREPLVLEDWNDENSKCVPKTQCAIPNTPPAPPPRGMTTVIPTAQEEKCPDPMKEWSPCSPDCPPGCGSRGARACTMQCIPSCVCIAPYILKDWTDRDSACVLLEQCGSTSPPIDTYDPAKPWPTGAPKPAPPTYIPSSYYTTRMITDGYATTAPAKPYPAYTDKYQQYPSSSINENRRSGFEISLREPPKAANPLPTCSDTVTQCARWASDGNCLRNSAFMMVFCQNSCNCCGCTLSDVYNAQFAQSCADRNKHCAVWAKAGQCSKNSEYMTIFCRATCGNC